MNGGTSLRLDAISRRPPESRSVARFLNVASGIDICYLTGISATGYPLIDQAPI
jgi:hypothetical protein